MPTSRQLTPLQERIARLLIQAQRGSAPSLEMIERELRQLLGAESATSQPVQHLERTTIERERVIEALAVLQLDAAATSELVLTPTHLSATVLDPHRPSGPMQSLRLRIESPRVTPTIATGDAAVEIAVLRDAVRARTAEDEGF